jgi:hypothetical protein
MKVREFAIQMTEAYDSRAGFNRGAIYAGSTTLLGLTGASSGLAAFGAAASAAGKSLPVVSTFVNGLFSVFDSRQLAQAYTGGANKLRRAVADSDAAFLQEPTMGGKVRKVADLQARVLDIVNEVEEARNSALPDPSKVVERALKAKEEIEEALSIKPKITSVTPRVASQKAGTTVRILGSGFDSKTTVVVSGIQLDPKGQELFLSEKEISFKTKQVQVVSEQSIVVKNRFDREAAALAAFV